MNEHMWRGGITWERSDGSRFDQYFPPRKSKAAANGDVSRALRYPGRNTFFVRWVERSELVWNTVEINGEAV